MPVTIGDFATTRIESLFSVVYVVFNTIMNLTTQDDQVACFENAAAHLGAGGRFVVEVGLPQLQRSRQERRFIRSSTRALCGSASTSTTSPTRARLAPLREARRSLRALVDPVPLCLAFRARPDARLAGMTSRERWSGWRENPSRARAPSSCGLGEARLTARAVAPVVSSTLWRPAASGTAGRRRRRGARPSSARARTARPASPSRARSAGSAASSASRSAAASVFARLDEEAVEAVAHDVGNAADPGRDDRRAGRERLDRAHGRPFVHGGRRNASKSR